MPLHIAIADDHSVAQYGIEAVLNSNPNFKVVLKVSNGKEIFDKLKESNTDCLILDLDLPGLNGLEFLKQNRNQFPMMKMILFTAHEGEGFFREAIHYGANGYILKSDNILNMTSAIQQVMEGEFYCSQKLIKFLINKEKTYSLSAKESEVLKMVVSGLSSREIGEKIGISRRTVEYYVAKLKERFEAENIVDLVNITKEKYFF